MYLQTGPAGERQRRWTLQALVEFWLAVTLRAPRALSQALYETLEGAEPLFPRVEATPEAYREKGRFSPPEQPERGKSQAWAYPVVANGRLYIRDLGALWSYDIKDPQAK